MRLPGDVRSQRAGLAAGATHQGANGGLPLYRHGSAGCSQPQTPPLTPHAVSHKHHHQHHMQSATNTTNTTGCLKRHGACPDTPEHQQRSASACTRCGEGRRPRRHRGDGHPAPRRPSPPPQSRVTAGS
jgi:hypothetical protein